MKRLAGVDYRISSGRACFTAFLGVAVHFNYEASCKR
jgi:hypothetical protein